MKKILYIEDDEDIASAVKIILENQGFKTEVAFCGKDGLMKAKEHFDLILLDIMLPDMSGWDIFEQLKGMRRTKFAFLSVIPVSGARLNELRKSGVSDYITKPFEKNDFINRINKIFGMNK